MMIEIVVDRDKLRRFHRLLKTRLACVFPGAGVALRAGDGGGAAARRGSALVLKLRAARLSARPADPERSPAGG